MTMFELFSYSLSLSELLIVTLVALLIGMAKNGVAGAGMVAVPLLAIIFGGKASTGVLLPILIFADLFAVSYYHSHANWYQLRRLLPTSLAGVVIGTVVGDLIDDNSFRYLMALIIFASVCIMIWQEKATNPNIPSSPWIVYTIGVIGGFASMIGNLAGPIMVLYLLAMRFPKNQFIGTAAWFFLVINISKMPFHVAVWQTISLNTFLFDLLLIPVIAAGAWLGVKIVHKIPEQIYRWFVIVTTAVAAVAMVV